MSSFLKGLTDGKNDIVKGSRSSRAYSLTHFTEGPNKGQPKDNLNVLPKNKAPLNPDGTRQGVNFQKAAALKRNQNRSIK